MTWTKEDYRAATKRYRERNPQACRERCRKWQERNAEAARQKAAAKRAAGREAYNAAARAAYKKYPLQNKARRAVRTALRRGAIVKPTVCPSCKDTNVKSRDMHAHHQDHIKPLEIQWLCKMCHAALRRVE